MCFDGCAALCERLRANDPTLTVLNLNQRHIGNDGVKAVAAALSHNTTVVVLFLQHNRIGPSGMQALADALIQRKGHLVHLYLDDNQLADAGCTALAQVLHHCPTLQVVKVADNQIGPTGAHTLAKALPHAPSLEYLSLQKNAIGLAGMQALQHALADDRSSSTLLRWLDVRCNKIRPQSYTAVIQGWTHVLQYSNETLSVLELWESTETIPVAAQAQLDVWLQWNRAGRRSLKHHGQDLIPVTRLLANAAGASPTVVLKTLQARPDLVVVPQHGHDE